MNAGSITLSRLGFKALQIGKVYVSHQLPLGRQGQEYV